MKELIDFSSLNEEFNLPTIEPVWVDWSECCTVINEASSGFEGRLHSEETKKKMSAKRKGVPLKGGKYCNRRKKGEPYATNIRYVRKTYLAISPGGEEFVVTAMGAFCKEHNLSKPCMCRVALGERTHHKQWKVKVL